MLPCCGSHTVNALFGSSAMLVGLFEQNQHTQKDSGVNKIHTVVTINLRCFLLCVILLLEIRSSTTVGGDFACESVCLHLLY